MEAEYLVSLADLLGVFCFALSGALLAAKLGYDFVGSLILGALTGLGGGLVRDLILGVTPVAFTSFWYVVMPVLASLLVYLAHRSLDQRPRPLQYADAAGLGLFAVVGTLKALDHGMQPWASVLMGVMTGVGGGILRDVVANVPPSTMQRHNLYLVPALIGASLTAVLHVLEWRHAGGLTLCVLVTFTIRVLSLHRGWGVPPASRYAHDFGAGI